MFSGTGSPMTLPDKLSDVTGSQKSKMAATKPEVTHISAFRQDSNEIPTATPMLSRTGIPMVLLCIYCPSQTEVRNPRWRLLNGVILCNSLGAAILRVYGCKITLRT